MAEQRSGTALGRTVLRTQSDERLVALTRERHDAAYEEVVRRYRPRLVRQASAIVPAHRAEDVVQESLAKALAALRSGDSDIVLGAWLATIVRNRALNDLRDAPGPHEELDNQYDGVPQPPMVAAQRQEVRDVVLAISSLPEQQRRALVGRELEGLSHEQIAAELGVTPGGARGLIFRARAGVRDALGALIPIPIVRFLMEAGAAEATGGAAAGAGVAVAGGGGGLKAAVGVLAVLATVGSGVAVESKLGNRDLEPKGATTATSRGGGGSSDSGGSRGSAQSSGPDGDESEGGEDHSGPGGGGHEPEEDDQSGPSGGGEPGDDHSGQGGGGGEPDEPDEPEEREEPEEDNSGPGNGGEPYEARSGSGGGDDEPEEPDAD